MDSSWIYASAGGIEWDGRYIAVAEDAGQRDSEGWVVVDTDLDTAGVQTALRVEEKNSSSLTAFGWIRRR